MRAFVGALNRGPTFDCCCYENDETLMRGWLLRFKTLDGLLLSDYR